MSCYWPSSRNFLGHLHGLQEDGQELRPKRVGIISNKYEDSATSVVYVLLVLHKITTE